MTTGSLCYCIQCTDRSSGKVGCFVFHSSNPYVAVSPVFDGLQGLYGWMAARGFESVPYSGFSIRPLGLPTGAFLVSANETIRAGDLVLWSRNPRDAWTVCVPLSPYVGSTPEAEGLCFARKGGNA
jgi:hypothetical protein